jgi:hypothetical protein
VEALERVIQGNKVSSENWERTVSYQESADAGEDKPAPSHGRAPLSLPAQPRSGRKMIKGVYNPGLAKPDFVDGSF